VLVVIVTVVAALLTRGGLTTTAGIVELFVVTSFILPTLLVVTESVASSPFSRGFSTFSSTSLETSSWDFCTCSSSSILKSTDLQEPLILSTTGSDLTGLSSLPSLVLRVVVALLSAAATSSTAKCFDVFSENLPTASSRRQATVDGDVDGNNDDVNVVVVVVVLLIAVVFVVAVVIVVVVVMI
uniref:Uncharacterized protein n=1 Tax=Glossina palpalis gambiensis TaxID=67801 RepID=A0A1B0B616_9MUSC